MTSLRLAILGLVVLVFPRFTYADFASFQQNQNEIDRYDFVEITIQILQPLGKNPFRDVQVGGECQAEKGRPIQVEGFCDSDDGKVYRIRFMATQAGKHTYKVHVKQGEKSQTHEGTFLAKEAKRKGLVRVDQDHPWHFVWEGTGEHYFWNGTTTYWLLGWKEESILQAAIDRLARLQVNRIRVALCGRTTDGSRWDEHLVVNTDKFRYRLNPWVAQNPDSVDKPGFDVTRYNLPFWQKCERMLKQARDKDMVVSLLFFLDGQDPGVDPFGKARAGCDEEKMYYHYAVARFAAYSNVMWDVTNEYHLFRTEPWVEQMGSLIKSIDPYQHLTSVHGNADYKFRTSKWSDFAMYQSWDEAGGHNFLLKARQAQAKTGRPMPQINEEYGYEDHYPTKWGGGKKAPARSADNRRRLAWGMYMAGGYQSTGERADQGTGKGSDTGGGWINGRGDDKMTMLEGYAHIKTCFTHLQWWKLEPNDELVRKGHFCLAEPGKQYLIYLPEGGQTTVQLAEGKYQAKWFQPRSGQWTPIGSITGPEWTSPMSKDQLDWAIVLQRE